MTRIPMVCSCGDMDHRVQIQYRDWYVETIGHEPTIDALVMGLMWRYDYSITSIRVDQWFGLAVAGHEDDETFYIECDHIVDGLIGIFQVLWTRYGRQRDTDAEED